MFSADGKFIIKENYESDVNEINKNSHLFYDAEGVLRASIKISDYGDFNIATNIGSVKQNLSFDSDGTLRTTGGRICLDDICLNKDDILKLKQVKLSGNVADNVAASKAADQSAIESAFKKEKLDKAIQMKTNAEIEIKQLEEELEGIERSLTTALNTQKDKQGQIDRADTDLEQVKAELAEESTKLTTAKENLENAKENNATEEETTSLEQILEAQQSKFDSVSSTEQSAREALDEARASKLVADREVNVRNNAKEDNLKKLSEAKAEAKKASDNYDLLTE